MTAAIASGTAAIADFQARTTGQDKTLANLRADATPRDRDEIKHLSEDFESLFLNIVMKSMRDTVQKSGLIDGGNAENIYQSMLDDEYSKTMAAQRHTGLANNIEEFLLTAANAQKLEKPEKAQGIKAYQAQGLQTPPKQAKMGDGAVLDHASTTHVSPRAR